VRGEEQVIIPSVVYSNLKLQSFKISYVILHSSFMFQSQHAMYSISIIEGTKLLFYRSGKSRSIRQPNPDLIHLQPFRCIIFHVKRGCISPHMIGVVENSEVIRLIDPDLGIISIELRK
jgi:hypothetical protein